MQIQFYKKNGEKDSLVEYPKILESEISDSRILEYLRYIRSQSRTVIANTKTKGEVSGGGKKPWKQKGTGRARHGSRRSPIWAGGGVTFGPRADRNFKIRMNKKERRAAILAVLTSKIKEKSAIGVTELKFSAAKTSEAAGIIDKLPTKGFIALFADKENQNLVKSFRNIPVIRLVYPGQISISEVMSADTLLFTSESLEELKNIFSDKKSKKKIVKANKNE